MCYSVFTNSWLLFLIYLHDDHNIMYIERERCALNLLSALMCQASSIFLVPLKKYGFRNFPMLILFNGRSVNIFPFACCVMNHRATWKYLCQMLCMILDNNMLYVKYGNINLNRYFEFNNIRKLQNGKHPIFLDFLVFTLCFSMVSYIIGCHHMPYSHFQSIKA